MSKEEKEKCNCGGHGNGAASNTIYGLGLVGAAIYFIAKATSFWIGVLGLLKALVWPAYLVYGLLRFLNI